MKIYIEITDENLLKWGKNEINEWGRCEDFKKIEKIFEKYDIKKPRYYETEQYFETDIRLIRKLKISKLEGSTEFDELINILFDKNIIKFIERLPGGSGTTGSSGASGTSGTSGISGSSGIDGTSIIPQIIPQVQITEIDLSSEETEEEKLFKELIKGTLNIGISKEYMKT